MAFAPTNLFTTIVATRPSCFTGAYRLTVHNRGTRVRISTGCLPHLFPQRVMDLLPDSGATPEPEIMIDRAPSRQIVGQQVPSAHTASHVENGVEDFAAAVFRRTTTGFHGRHERGQLFPFGLREVRV